MSEAAPPGGAPQPGFPGVLVIGAGKMGGALFTGWKRAGLGPSMLVDPAPMPGLARPEDRVVSSPEALTGAPPTVVLLAVKPQIFPDVAPALAGKLAAGSLVVSILAGRQAAGIAALLPGTAVVRVMPNTPAAIGQGMSVAFAGPGVTAAQRALAHRLLAVSGEVAWVEDEDLVDRATGVSGSGPAYVFLLAELLEAAALDQGLPADLARLLARKTVSGAGALLASVDTDAAQLRRDVTSAKGATEQALRVLMADEAWPRAVREAVAASIRRSRELAA